jgi:hypothetical protein
MKLVRSYIGDQRPALAKTKFLAESIVHTQDTITVVKDPKDEDWDAGKYTLETIIGILSGAVTDVTGTPAPDLSACAGAANEQYAKAAGRPTAKPHRLHVQPAPARPPRWCHLHCADARGERSAVRRPAAPGRARLQHATEPELRLDVHDGSSRCSRYIDICHKKNVSP